MSKTFLILGGYGNTGVLISEFLLKYTNSKLILAGRNLSRAQQTAKLFNDKFLDDRVKPIAIGSINKKSLAEIFEPADMIIVASSTIDYVKEIAEAAIIAGKDYIDIQLSSEKKIITLMELEDRIRENKLLFITDCGFHPGIPGTLIRYAANHFDKLEIANVGSLINLNWKELNFSESTIMEMVDEFKEYSPLVFQDNHWKKIPYKDYKKFDFDNDFLRTKCAPMMLEELRNLPIKYPTLRETGFYVSGFNPFVNYIIIPFGYAFLRILPNRARKPFGKALIWGLKKFSRPPFRTVIVMSAIGRQNELTREIRIRLAHSDGYWLTAASVVALLFQYLRGKFTKPGLYLQGSLVDPASFLKDIEALGVDVSVKN